MGVNWQLLIAVAIALFAAVSGWPITVLVLRISSRRTGPDKAVRPSSARDARPRNRDAGLRGGLWIGLVERFACALAIMLGQPALVAVVVAVKGLGRFKELTTPQASERFVLGTLVSITWACLLGAIWLAVTSV